MHVLLKVVLLMESVEKSIMEVKHLFRIFVLFFSTLVLTGCVAVPNGNFQEGFELSSGKEFVVWMLSDIQPPNVAERNVFEAAVTDMNENIGPVNMGIMAGDLLTSRSQDEAFRWFVENRKRAKVTDWFQIAGNHDVRSGPIFYRYFPQPHYYAVELGNLLFLFLSDESTASRTDISEEAFFWWKDMVTENRDRVVITVTHAQLAGSGLIGSSLSSRVIHDSKRFEDVLQNEKVALWVSGHSHVSQGFSGSVTIRKNLGGTCFVNVSSISDESFLDSESRFLFFINGSDVVWMRSRNHSKKSFNTNLDIPVSLGRKFLWNGERPQVL